jgi:hypothetical protein
MEDVLAFEQAERVYWLCAERIYWLCVLWLSSEALFGGRRGGRDRARGAGTHLLVPYRRLLVPGVALSCVCVCVCVCVRACLCARARARMDMSGTKYCKKLAEIQFCGGGSAHELLELCHQ